MTTVRATILRLAAYGLLDLAEEVSVRHRVSTELILSGNKDRRVTAARHELWSLIYERPHWSYRLIAEVFHVDLKTVWEGVDSHLNKQPRLGRCG